MKPQILRAVLQLYPFYSGCGTIANQKLCQAATVGMKRTVAAPLRNGYTAVVDPQEFLGRSIYFTGEWDPKITWACNKILREGDTFLDIGAHCGVSSLYASKLVGSSGAVYSFEPQPALARMLRESVDLNDIRNIHVHEVALSRCDGTASLHIQSDKPILASLARSGTGSTIEVITKDAGAYLQRLDVGPIRLIKIDVEGHEPEIFRSAYEFLSHNRPDAILFESIDKEGPFYERETVKALASLGYSFFALPKSMFTMRTIEVGSHANREWHDFIAVGQHEKASLSKRLKSRMNRPGFPGGSYL